MVDKICPKCGELKPTSEYYASKPACKECVKLAQRKYNASHKDEIKERNDKYYEDHREAVIEWNRDYRKHHTSSISVNKKRYYKEHIDEKRQYNKKYWVATANKQLAKHRLWCTTTNGRIYEKIHRAKRRKLGYNPINEPFEHSCYHHLRHVDECGHVDNDIGIHIPTELHNSVHHNGNNGYNMNVINLLALKWYLDNTSASDINPIAIKLYEYYQKQCNNN